MTQGTTRNIGRESVEAEEFERRLNRLFEAVELPPDTPHQRGPVRWFAEHRLVGVSTRQIHNYLGGRTPIPDRIVAVMELLEEQHDVEDRSEP